jgi:hypothetical protein
MRLAILLSFAGVSAIAAVVGSSPALPGLPPARRLIAAALLSVQRSIFGPISVALRAANSFLLTSATMAPAQVSRSGSS